MGIGSVTFPRSHAMRTGISLLRVKNDLSVKLSILLLSGAEVSNVCNCTSVPLTLNTLTWKIW